MRAILKKGMLLGQGPVPLCQEESGIISELLHESNAEMRNAAREKNPSLCPGVELDYI